MPANSSRKAALYSALFLLTVGAAFLGTLRWLRAWNPAAVNLAAPIGTFIVLALALVLAARQTRRLDEVQAAGHRYASSLGLGLGGMLTLALVTLPPVANWLVDLVYVVVHASPDPAGRRAVYVAVAFTSALMMVIQSLVMVIATYIWWRRVGGLRAQS
jgi:hypothetical protein